MREKERIERILNLLREIWEIEPDLRLGQILVNAASSFEVNPFYFEDSDLEESLKEFLDKLLQRTK